MPSFEPLAYGEQSANPARRLSFIVTRELKGVEQLDHYLQREGISLGEQRLLLRQMAQLTRQMHSHGINHRDLYLCHFLVDIESIAAWRLNGSQPRLYLADLHRAQLRSRVPRRWRVKDIAGLCFSMAEIGLGQGEMLRVLRHYFAQPLAQVNRANCLLLEHIYWRTRRFKARELRHRRRAQGRAAR